MPIHEKSRLFANCSQLLEDISNWRAQEANAKGRDALAKALKFANLESPVFDDVAGLARNALLAFDNDQITEAQLISTLMYRSALRDYPRHGNVVSYDLTPNNLKARHVLKQFLTIQKDLILGLPNEMSEEQISQIIAAMQADDIPSSERTFLTIDIKEDELAPVLKRILELKFLLLMPVKIDTGYRLIVPSYTLLQKIITTINPNIQFVPTLGELSDLEILTMHKGKMHPLGLSASNNTEKRTADSFVAGDYGFAWHDIYHIILLMFLPNMPLINRIADVARDLLDQLTDGVDVAIIAKMTTQFIDGEFRQFELNPDGTRKVKAESQAQILLQTLITSLISILLGIRHEQRNLEIFVPDPIARHEAQELLSSKVNAALDKLLRAVVIDLINNFLIWKKTLGVNSNQFFDLLSDNSAVLSKGMRMLERSAARVEKNIFDPFSNMQNSLLSTSEALAKLQNIMSQILSSNHEQSALTPEGRQNLLRYKEVRTKLITFIKEGLISETKQLLAESPEFDCNFFGPDGYSPLQEAARLGQVEIVQLLLANRAEVDLTKHDELIATPLVLAATEGHPEVVRELLTHNASIKASDAEKRSLLDICIRGGFVSGLLQLLQKTSISNLHIDYLASNKWVHPNCQAVLERYQQFKQNYRRALKEGFNALQDFLKDYPKEFSLNTLLEHEEISPSNSREEKQVEGQEEFLSKKLDLRVPFEFTSDTRCFELLRLHGANINLQDNKGRTILHRLIPFTCGSNQVKTAVYKERVSYFIKENANCLLPADNGETSLNLMIEHSADLALDALAKTSELPKNGISYNLVLDLVQKVANQDGQWQDVDIALFKRLLALKLPFHIFVLQDLEQFFGKQHVFSDMNSYKPISIWSLLRGSPIFAKPKDLLENIFTVEKRVVGEVQLPVALRELCLQQGANPHEPGVNGAGELHVAAKYNWHDYAKKLLTIYHCDMNSVNSDGNTPLHLALAAGHSQIVGLLIESGANVKALNKRGQTPYQYAQACEEEKKAQLAEANKPDSTRSDPALSQVLNLTFLAQQSHSVSVADKPAEPVSHPGVHK